MAPTMEELMTLQPCTIGADMSVAAARSMMDGYHVHHLPVRLSGELVGVVSSGDLARAQAHALVSEVMREPLVVGPTADVADVANTMAEQHNDAAIVVSGDRVIGIFTASDAERALAAALRRMDGRR